MLTFDSFWRVSSPLPFVEVSLSILGVLYLAYDMSNRRSKILHRLVWMGSSWLILTCVLILSFAFLTKFYSGYVHQIIWRLVGVLSFCGLMLLFILFSRVSVDDLPYFNWGGLVASTAPMGIELVGVGIVVFNAPIVVLLFVSPNLVTIGALFFFASIIQRQIRNIPKGIIAFIGGLLIVLACTLLIVHPSLHL